MLDSSPRGGAKLRTPKSLPPCGGGGFAEGEDGGGKHERMFHMKKQIISTTNAPAAIGPYSQAVKAGNLLFVSGQIPLDPATGAVVEGDVTVQAKQVFENVKAILTEAGATFEDVVKTTVFLKDMNDFAAMNAVYASYYTENCPARSAVEVGRLPKDVLVEVETIAYI